MPRSQNSSQREGIATQTIFLPYKILDAPDPVERPFDESEYTTHKIGHFNTSGAFEYERIITFGENYTELWIWKKDPPTGPFNCIERAYKIDDGYVGIRFVKEADGYFYLKFQSSRHHNTPDSLTKFELSKNFKIGFKQVSGPSINFIIGADDIRTLTAHGIEPVGQLFLELTPGKVADIRYINPDKIEFWFAPISPTT